MNADELFEATAQSILAALERDAASGWGAVVYTITKDKVILICFLIAILETTNNSCFTVES